MPNPLMRIGTPVQSRTRVERPKPITPAMESVEGDNHPYRGLETHGVPDSAHPHDPETYGFDAEDPTADGGTHWQAEKDADKHVDAVPVYIIRGADDATEERRMFGTDRFNVDNTAANNAANRAVELVGRSDNRFNLKLTNMDAVNWVLVAGTREECFMRGYPILPGKEWTCTAENAVFVMAVTPTLGQPATPTPIAYTTEYTIKEK